MRETPDATLRERAAALGLHGLLALARRRGRAWLVIDRLCHNAEIIFIDADSYRNKETRDRNVARKTARRPRRES